MPENSTKCVSVVVPYVKPFVRELLDLTLFSLSGQNDVSIEIILQISGGESERDEVLRLVERHPFESPTRNNIRIQSVDNYDLESWKSAWKSATGQYFCVLEPNSVLYLNALSTLLIELQKSSQAFAFGAEKRSYYSRDNHSSAFHVTHKHLVCNDDNWLSIFFEKNISLSSCLMDRTQIDPNVFHRVLQGSMTDAYHLLLNLFGQYQNTAVLRKVPLSEKYFHDKEQSTHFEKLEATQLKSSMVSVPIFEINQTLSEINRFREEAKSLSARIVRKLKKLFLHAKWLGSRASLFTSGPDYLRLK